MRATAENLARFCLGPNSVHPCFCGCGEPVSADKLYFSKTCRNTAFLNRNGRREQYAEKQKERRMANPKQAMLNRSKQNAKVRNLEHSLTIQDIPNIPEFCPVFPWIKLVYRVGHSKKGAMAPDDSPSLDRINNLLGYVPGNIRIISFKANTAKKDWSDIDLVHLGLDAAARTNKKIIETKSKPLAVVPIDRAHRVCECGKPKPKNQRTCWYCRTRRGIPAERRVFVKLDGRLVWNKEECTWSLG